MAETKKTYEQYCTHLKRNIIVEEVISESGRTALRCTDKECTEKNEKCRNKLRQIS